jgi:hypothetical protein
MREKIQNTLKIACKGLDLTTISNIEFYVTQTGFYGCYVPEVVSPTEMVVIVPFEDAKRLKRGKVELQFAFTDANGIPNAVDPIEEDVGKLLKGMGYDPV